MMDSTTRDAVDELLQTYGETGGINYLAAAASLPSRLAIEAACAELMSLMFPGFRSEALVSSEDLIDITRVRVRRLHARLKTEICRSLGKIPPDEPTEAKAEEVLSAFLKGLPAVRRLLWTDIDAAYEGDPASKSYEEIILAYPALEAIAIYRMAHLLYDKVPLIPRIMTEWAHSRTGHRYSSRCRNRLAFLYRPRDGRSRWRDYQNRIARETLSRRVVHCALTRSGASVAGAKTPPYN